MILVIEEHGFVSYQTYYVSWPWLGGTALRKRKVDLN